MEFLGDKRKETEFQCKISTSPGILVNSADFTLITSRYWNALFQSHISRENATHFLQLNTQYQFSFHLVPITAGWPDTVWTQACPRLLHTTSPAGIEPQTP